MGVVELLPRMTAWCAIVVAAMLLGCSCTAFVLPQPAATTFNVLQNLDDKDDYPIGTLLSSSQLQKTINTLVTAAALFTTALTSPVNIHVNTNEPAITIEKSQAYALNENQLFISDVWFKVTTQYFDQSFNGLERVDGEQKKRKHFKLSKTQVQMMMKW